MPINLTYYEKRLVDIANIILGNFNGGPNCKLRLISSFGLVQSDHGVSVICQSKNNLQGDYSEKVYCFLVILAVWWREWGDKLFYDVWDLTQTSFQIGHFYHN